MKRQSNIAAKSRNSNKKQSPFGIKLFVGLISVVVIVGVLYFGLSKATPLQNLNPFVEKIAIEKPHPDLARARKLTIDPANDTVMQITTREKIRISLIVPKGTITKKQIVEMIPYYYDKNAKSPSAGVIISPASVSFKQPVTLLFDLSESQFKTDAPKNLKDKKIRFTGNSQVLTLNQDAQELIPVLVARELETSTQLRARILSGGGYVFTTSADRQITWAKHAFSKEKVNSISLLEATNALLGNKQTLTADMRKKADGAVAKILGKKNPPPSEIYAALVAKKLLQDSKISLIGTAYAIETSEGYFLTVCKKDGYTVEEYVGFAKAAQFMGFDAIGENCMVKAKNIVTEVAQKVLNNPTATLKEIITALQDVQYLGIDEESQIDEALMGKAKQTAENEAKKVAEDQNATDVEAALELQKLQAFGVEGPVTDSLEKRLTETVENKETTQTGDEPEPPDEPKTTPDDYGDGTTIDEEQILTNQAMSAIGIAFLKIAGFEELDEESLKKKFSRLAEETTMLNEAVYQMCLELGGDDCDSKHAQAVQDIDKALETSYAVAEDIGQTQSQAYDDPEYDNMLYIEPTEEPYEESEASYPEEENNEIIEEDDMFNSSETSEGVYQDETVTEQTSESMEPIMDSSSEENSSDTVESEAN